MDRIAVVGVGPGPEDYLLPAAREAIAGADFVKGAGGRVVTIPLTEGRSTTNIVEKIRQVYG